MVVIKIAILLFFIVVAFTAFQSDHFVPFAPNGREGITAAAGVIFFAYIGFDAVTTGSEECKNPSRDLPIAIIGSLVISTVLYVLVALAAVGVAPVDTLSGSDAPLAAALREGAGLAVGGRRAGRRSTDRDHQCGPGHHVRADPHLLRHVPGRAAAPPARQGAPALRHPRPADASASASSSPSWRRFVPLDEIVKLVNIGTLFAFILVNIGVIVLRRTKPDMARPFRVPLSPVLPAIGVILCLFLMKDLPGTTWIRFLVWLVVGMLIYFTYSVRHSRLRLEGPLGNRQIDAGPK